MRVEPGQTYKSNRPSGPTVRVVRVDGTGFNGYGRPAAWVEDATTGKRGRWVPLDSLHTDAMPRKSGYRLHTPA